MTEEELVEYSEIDKKVKKLQDTLSSRVKDLEKQANYIKSNRIQYTNLTVGKDVELADKVGQKVGTVTQEEAKELGIDENLVEEFVPQKTENEYKKLLEEIKELKIERAKLQVTTKETVNVVEEHNKNITALNKELAKAEEVLGKDTISPPLAPCTPILISLNSLRISSILLPSLYILATFLLISAIDRLATSALYA